MKHILYTVDAAAGNLGDPFRVRSSRHRRSHQGDGNSYTILRNAWYMKTSSCRSRTHVAAGQCFSSTGDGRISHIGRP